MPDLGVPSTGSRPVSHTATQEWQSFEMRMRRRRAERCVVRAKIALDAGFEEDARTALEEANHLDSRSPDFDTLRQSLQERRRREAEDLRQRKARRIKRYGIAAALTLLVGASPFIFSGSGEVDTPPPPRAESAAAGTTGLVSPRAEPAREPAPVPSRAPHNTSDLPQDVAAPARREAVIADAERARAAEKASIDRLKVESKPQRGMVLPPKPEPTIESRPGTVDVPIRADAAPPPATVPLTTSGVTELPGTATAPAVPRVERAEASPTEARSAPPAPPNEEPRVRAVLARYEAAYSRLNASAAQAVWPGVDERSLARAFENLESQRVSLGRCSVAVSGVTASANCDGSATWTPKVGGGTRTEPRRWQFELSNTAGVWQIIKAEAR